MKVLFINPNTRYLGTLLTVYPPLGILYMSSTLLGAGHEVKIIDADIDNLNYPDIHKIISEYQPDIIGISMNTLQSRAAFETASKIKQNHDIKIIAGGPHPSALKEELLKKCKSLDAIAYGEGEETFLELVKHSEEGGDLSEVKGICFRDGNGEIRTNEPREPISDLDSLPRPALHLIGPISRYPGPYPTGAHPSIHVLASRGCPFQCTFCSNPVWERKIRLRSAESVLSEVEWLRKNFKVREIFFQDDTFNIDRVWFEAICNGLIERGLNKKLIFKSPFRANEKLVDRDLLILAKKAGFWMIFYGVESGNQEILNSVKKNLRLEEIRRAFELTRDAGIKTYASFMIGNLGESRSTVQDTISFAKMIDPDYYGFAIATPYPGSEFYNLAKKAGILKADFDEYTLGKYVLETENFNPGEVEELAEQARRSLEKNKSSIGYRLRKRLSIDYPFNRTSNLDHLVSQKSPDEEVLDTEIIMGENDWQVLGPGWYALENWPPMVRWTGKKATAYLKRSASNPNYLCITVLTFVKGLNLELRVNGEIAGHYLLNSAEWKSLKVPLANLGDNLVKVDLEVREAWIPDEVLKNGDRRKLGVAVERIWLD